MPAGRPLKFETPAALDKAVDSYFNECVINEKPFTITGLALALDTNRQTLLEYNERPEYADTLKRARAKCENYAEERLFGSTQVTGAIFNLKNNYDWKDKLETDSTIKGDPENPLQHKHSGKIDMGADLIASAIERILGKNEKDTNDIPA